MFDELRSAFREAVENFRTELDRDQVSGDVDRLLKGMIGEVTDARAHLSDLQGQAVAAKTRRDAEVAQLETCERRERMALDIGDVETAKIAGEYADRHRERVEVLDRKIEALESEIALSARDVAEMTEKLKEARARRSALAAEAGRAGTRESLRETDRLFDEFDRMEERVGDEGFRASAAEELRREMGGDAGSEYRIDFDAPVERPAVDFDARLEELKRRMGESE